MQTSKSGAVAGAAALLVTCSMLAGCDLDRPGVTDSEAAGVVELRSYEVPAESKAELIRMLQAALGSGETRTGRVSEGPGGALVVVAPARIQNGIGEMLERGFTTTQTSPSPVKLTYWLLVARPMETGDQRPSFAVAGPRRLTHLEPVMSELVAGQGSAEFALLEEIQVLSMVQDPGRAAGKMAEVEQTVIQAGDQMVALVSISVLPKYSFASQVSLRAGQYLVVGQVGMDGRLLGPGLGFDPFPDSNAGDPLTLYYVMMAELVP
ncbi:MAG: hypothetical protein O3A25_09775 [Acidobacteria bacterium]|nr:hypothetical protein [Acidobacteriota bacterium]